MGFADFFFGPVLEGQKRIEAKVDSLNQKQEAHMSATQQKLDELKTVMGTLVTKINAVLDGMQEAKDDPAELQALIDQGKEATAALDSVLNPAPPEPTP